MHDSTDPATVVRDGIAYLTIPAPGFASTDLATSLVAALERARRAPEVRSIVIDASAAGLRSAGASAATAALCEAIAAGTKRVYCALGGPADGDGLAIALACDGIYAAPSATFAFGTDRVRSERLVERLLELRASEAVEPLRRGEVLDALQAYAAGVLDGILVNDLATEIAIFAGREAALPRGRYEG